MNGIKEKDLSDGMRWEYEFKVGVEELDIPIEKLGTFDKFDFKVKDNIYVEIKLRNCSYRKYETTKIILKKYIQALERATKGESCILVIRWEDYIGYINLIETPPIQTSYDMGRKDRGYIEKSWYAYFDINNFKEYIPNIFI